MPISGHSIILDSGILFCFEFGVWSWHSSGSSAHWLQCRKCESLVDHPVGPRLDCCNDGWPGCVWCLRAHPLLQETWLWLTGRVRMSWILQWPPECQQDEVPSLTCSCFCCQILWARYGDGWIVSAEVFPYHDALQPLGLNRVASLASSLWSI